MYKCINFCENFAEPLEASGWSGPEQDTSGERDRDSGDGTGGRERTVAVMNPKKFLAFPITIISVEGLLSEVAFSSSTRALNLILSKLEMYTQARKSLGKINCILSV